MDKLGLHSNMALWVYSKEASQFLLLIVTDFFDLKGPLEVTKYMFAAYNASALPKEIDPFNVQFCSPEQIVGRRLVEIGSIKVIGRDSVAGTSSDQMAISFDNLETHTAWILRNEYDPLKRIAPLKAPKPVDIRRKWNRFVSNVEKLAA